MQPEPYALGRGIPTATNVDHIGWTVPDLDEAVAFCVDVLGGEEIFRAGPFADPVGDWMTTQFDVHPRASTTVAMVRLGPTQVVELLAWESPDGPGEWPRTSDAGATHLAIHVGDVEAAMAYLKAHGCVACGEPVLLADVPQAGITILYVRTPIGLYLELVSHPGGVLPYEESTSARLLPRAVEWRNG
ncbi:glyoxalase [Streptomyces sp. CB09001]|uniref:VOC family protein n=1 Tax=unclassified Streptomyces TaxID=2593676 RepID=UPI000E21AD13|nr:VOC family protein [Streptomyces sp. CB09001]AXL92226.1 glyoxalase [Streptomyces sp. CB09001]